MTYVLILTKINFKKVVNQKQNKKYAILSYSNHCKAIYTTLIDYNIRLHDSLG